MGKPHWGKNQVERQHKQRQTTNRDQASANHMPHGYVRHNLRLDEARYHPHHNCNQQALAIDEPPRLSTRVRKEARVVRANFPHEGEHLSHGLHPNPTALS